MDGGGHIWYGLEAIRGGVASKHLGDFSCLGTHLVTSSENIRQHLFVNYISSPYRFKLITPHILTNHSI